MTFTGPLARLPDEEQATIFRIAATIGVPATFLAAIRLAENGGPGREFGVVSEEATTFEAQALSAAVSIRNTQYRYVAAHAGQWPTDQAGELSDAFIAYMAARWAPVGAQNDPHALNQYWPTNVSAAYRASGVRFL